MLYQIKDGTLTVGSEAVLEHFDFEIKGKDKIAIVGPNGAGKTTLLRLIHGELALARDDKRKETGIRLARNVTIGMLRQQPFSDGERTVFEEVMEACPYKDSWDRERFDFEQKYDRIFTGFGFQKEDKEKKIKDFSGGEQTKIAFIRLLLEEPDILLLDEPTNHLDFSTVEWLEGYLSEYPKAVVMVSHDRFFLDQTAEIVYELSGKKLTRYVGNYTQYRKEKRKKTELQKKQYDQQMEEVKRLEELILKFKNKPKKAAFARSRKKILERMERIEPPKEMEGHLFTGELLPERLGSKWVLEAEDLQIGYDKVLLMLSLRIRRGQKIGIIGPNGAGKTTFLKTAAGILQPLKGKISQGMNIDMGYFDQLSAAISSDESVIEHFHKRYPGMNEKDARQYLAAYLFAGKEAGKLVNQLSGGERSRLVLAELLAEKPNFLILDEPTNHMDIQAKETLESAFQAYKGTMLFVSHDRYFINQVADALLIFENGKVTYYPFGYQHYIERQQKKERGETSLLAGELSAEDQAMIEGLKSVPKKATLLGRELSTEQAFFDWQMRLAKENLEEKRTALEQLLIKGQEELLEHMLCENFEEIRHGIKMREEQACMAYEEACFKWFELWEETEEAEE